MPVHLQCHMTSTLGGRGATSSIIINDRAVHVIRRGAVSLDRGCNAYRAQQGNQHTVVQEQHYGGHSACCVQARKSGRCRLIRTGAGTIAPVTEALPLAEALPFILQNLYPYYIPSLMGGLVLGALVVEHLVISGKVVGISGAVRGLVEGEKSPWRILFVTGLVTGGLLLKYVLYPQAFGGIGQAISTWRLAAAGVLVGMGTSLGNGCTSGHGICGNARLSLRSFISTCTFMCFGALAAAALHTARVEGLPLGFIVPPVPGEDLLTLSARVLASAVTFVVGMASLTHFFASQGKAKWITACEGINEFGIGLFFALGLGISGMADPAKVAGFLSIFSGTFDASLIFVMGGALLVALPGYQFILRTNVMNHPLACSAFSLPTSKEINAQLVIGSALFGCGWGLAGLCPGPGLVGLANASASNVIFVGSMVIGMALTKLYQRVRASFA